MTDRFNSEEDFHSNENKLQRKERKYLQASDRSKYKKTDQALIKQDEINTSLPRARVVAVTGEGTWVELAGKRQLCSIKGSLKKERKLSKNLVAAGDFVRISESTISQIEPRFSTLSRTDITGKKEQLIAVNIDQAIIVVSLVEPPLKPALIDRYIIAAANGGIRPIIVLNKADLLPSSPSEQDRYKEFLTAYQPLGFPILTLSIKTGVGIEELQMLMKEKTSVICGQSGVGKSSLLNEAFQMERKTGELSGKTFKGTHTTTVAELIPIPNGGYCIDTPGIRSFGLWKLERSQVKEHFTDIQELSHGCHYKDCSHTYEPQCSVIEALEEGKLPVMRFESYCSLLDEADGSLDNRTRKKLED